MDKHRHRFVKLVITLECTGCSVYDPGRLKDEYILNSGIRNRFLVFIAMISSGVTVFVHVQKSVRSSKSK